MQLVQGINICQFLGRVSENVNFREVSGKTKANFTMIVTEKIGDKENTQLVNVENWQAYHNKILSHVKKGCIVHVQASYSNRPYEKNGQKKYWQSFILKEIKVLSWVEHKDQQQNTYSPGHGQQNIPDSPFGEPPF